MDLQQINKKILKSIIKEIINEDIGLFKEVIRDLFIENKIIISEEPENRRKRIEAMINEDFGKYDDVFNALA